MDNPKVREEVKNELRAEIEADIREELEAKIRKDLLLEAELVKYKEKYGELT